MKKQQSEPPGRGHGREAAKPILMTCNECQEELPARALSGTMDHQDGPLDEHLAACPECRAQWESMSQGLSQLHEWQVEAVPPDLSARTMARIQAEAERPLGFWARLDRALQRFAAHRPTPLTGLATVCIAVMLLGHVLSPNLFRGRSSGDGSGCQRNLKLVTQALEAYAHEHRGLFPDHLEDLEPDYLREVPDCPDSGHNSYSPGYAVSADHRSFTLLCNQNP